MDGERTSSGPQKPSRLGCGRLARLGLECAAKAHCTSKFRPTASPANLTQRVSSHLFFVGGGGWIFATKVPIQTQSSALWAVSLCIYRPGLPRTLYLGTFRPLISEASASQPSAVHTLPTWTPSPRVFITSGLSELVLRTLSHLRLPFYLLVLAAVHTLGSPCRQTHSHSTTSCSQTATPRADRASDVTTAFRSQHHPSTNPPRIPPSLHTHCRWQNV